MKKIIKIGFTFFLLIAGFNANSAVLSQPLNSIVTKSKFNGNAPGTLTDIVSVDMITAGSNINEDSSFHHIDTRYKTAIDRLKQQAGAIKAYLVANNYNTDYCFLVDMSLPSGKKRFFVYNLNTDNIEQSSMVSHGIGSNGNEPNEELQFSNDPSSLQTSLGRYRIGASYNGSFGLSYKLFGLDKTNDRAYERTIVLHAHRSIPITETYPVEISVSFGCPSVAPSFLDTLSTYINGSKKPVMMWIYN